ncbi:MAG: PhnD/SsuA/transferrin family substrate-binding protein [Betaproteobacteria bacterium]
MIANARMYAVNPAAGAAWRALLAWVLRRAELDCRIIEYPVPAPLAGLWSRDDLGCALMCGLPYSLRTPVPQLVAAPIPSPARYGGRAIYMTDLAVRADSTFQRIEDTFGGVAGYTVADSQSGYYALRRFLAPFRQDARRPLFRAVVGNLLNARGVIDALADGRIDVGPLDSYSHDLLRHLEPDLAARIRVVASTGPTAIPAFVATAPLTVDRLTRLREAFALIAATPVMQDVRDTLLLRGFALPQPADYVPMRESHDALQRAPELW